MKQLRFDSVKINFKKRSPDGYLISEDSPIARVGVQTYTNPDGTKRREFRPPEEVGKVSSLQTFGLLPLTFEHPPQMLDAETVAKYQVGITGEQARFDGKYIRSKIKILDAKAIDKIINDKINYLSVGYVCDTDDKPGIYEGERYDSIQRNIVANHVAITERPRGGKELQLRFDSEKAKGCNCNVAFSDFKAGINEDLDMLDDEKERFDMRDLATMPKEDLIISIIEDLMSEKKDLAQERADAYELLAEMNADAANVASSDRVSHAKYATEQYHIKDLQERNDALGQVKEDLEIKIEQLKRKVNTAENEVDILRQQKESEIKERCDSYLSSVMDCMVPVGENIWKYLGPPGYLQNPDTTMSPASIKRLAIQTSARKDSEIVKRLDSMDDAAVIGAFAVWKIDQVSDSPDSRLRNSVYATRNDSSSDADRTNVQVLQSEYLGQQAQRWKNYKR